MGRLSIAEVGWNRKVKGGADKVAWYLYNYLPMDRHVEKVVYWSWKNTQVGGWSGIVHNHTFFNTIASSCRRRGLKHVATVHAIPPERLYRSMQKKTLELSDKVVTINEWLRNYVIKRYKIEPDKVVVIPNGAPMNKFRRVSVSDRDYFVVGYHGRITEDKGIDELINAVRIIREQLDIDVRLRLLGWDYYGIPDEDWIIYDGLAMTDEQIAHWLDQIDLEVLPTKDDQQPLTVIEALLRGVPVLVSRLDTLKEFEGLVEWITNPEDVWEIALRISKYALGKKPNTAKLQELAEKRFSIERMVRDYVSLFLTL